MECILIKEINFEDENFTDNKVTAKSKKLRPLKITCIGMLFDWLPYVVDVFLNRTLTVYSVFCFCEYMMVFSNVSFHFSQYFDLRGSCLIVSLPLTTKHFWYPAPSL